MLVESPQWEKHSLTGRELNKFNAKKQISIKENTSSIVKVLNKLEHAESLTAAFKSHYPKTQNKTLESLKALYISLLLLKEDEVLKIDGAISSINSVLIKQQGLKKVISKLENLGHIEVFNGYSYKNEALGTNQAMNMAIRLKR